MRLDHRLGAAGIEPAPRSRLLASLKLNSEISATDIAVLTAAADVPALTHEATWLDALSPPLEVDGMGCARGSSARSGRGRTSKQRLATALSPSCARSSRRRRSTCA